MPDEGAAVWRSGFGGLPRNGTKRVVSVTEKQTSERDGGRRVRDRLSALLAALLLLRVASWSFVRRRLVPVASAAGRHLRRATGWWTEHLSRGLPAIGKAGVTSVGWATHRLAGALSAAGARMVTATGRLQAGAGAVAKRLVPSVAGFVSVAAGTVTWVVLVSAATVPAASGYADVVGVEFAMPENTALPALAERSVVYAADGSVLAVLHEEQDRRVVDFDSLPDHVWQAAVSAEDRRFFEHEGYDVEAIMRAFVANVQARGIAQGGSTITQQLAKQNFLSAEQTIERKAQELTYALALEERLSKEQLLERYLNQVYLGSGAYGVAAGAEEWFGVAAADLTIEQAALLAGMIRAPGRLNPREDPETAKARRDVVIQGMAEEGHISAEQADAALATPVEVLPDRERDVSEPFVVEAVKDEFFDSPAFGEDRAERIERLFNGGLAVHTTIDPRIQEVAHRVVQEHYPTERERTAALAAVDPRNGRVVATHSGKDFSAEQFNLATQGRRQAGSAFKVFVLTAALEQGRSIFSTVNGASPRQFDWDPHQEPWEVGNFAGASYGHLTLHEALTRSVNTAFGELILDTGISEVVETAKRLGIAERAFGPPSARGPAIALGGLDRGVTPLEMASAFGTLGQGGLRAQPYLIERVTDARGQEVYRRKPQRQRVVDRQVAGTVVNAMQSVVDRGTGTRAQLPPWPVAGKTGTAQDYTDAWFVGTTPVLSTAVWVGHPDLRRPYPRMTGGQFAAPVWRDFMAAALADVAPEPFPLPPPPASQQASGENAS